MGNSQSSRASAKKIKAPNVEHNLQSESARGRKSLPTSGADRATPKGLTNVEVQLVSTNSTVNDDVDGDGDGDDSDANVADDTESIDYESEEEDTDEEIDAGLTERRLILEDAKMLKQYATFHLHPEMSVETSSPFAKGRNYFNRSSAPTQMTVEESQERALILEDAQQLKMYANFHLHPENPVETTDVTVCGRNFFTRASADEYFTEEDAEERELILAECMALKTVAGYHLHPERPVESHGDGTSFGRNFFGRASAPDQLMYHEAHERAAILQDAAMLKQYAGYHFHPERPVESQGDATSFGRNFFGRASAPDQLMFHEAHERAAILEDAAMLKQYAGYHFHPERPVESTDFMACARNYFTRPSAHIDSDLITSEGRANSVAEAMVDETDYGFELDEDLHDLHDFRASLTKLVDERIAATDYAHPIKSSPIKTIARSDDGEEQEGNLSRSPSSIMLFGYEENAY